MKKTAAVLCKLYKSKRRATPPTLLFVSQRVNGIEIGCLLGGIETKEDAHGAGEEKGNGNDSRTNQGGRVAPELKTFRAADSEQHADAASGGGHHYRFHEELQHDVAAARANGH